jgi:hypothetical protein
MAPLDAIATCVIAENTGVPFADSSHTQLNNAALLPELLIINLPFIATEWETALNNISSFNKFSNVPISIRLGFDMGVPLPPLYTYTPPNHSSALSFPDNILFHIHNELFACRYTGPFSSSRLQSLIGPFRTSSLGTVTTLILN